MDYSKLKKAELIREIERLSSKLNISKYKQVESSFQVSKQIFESIVLGISEGIVLTDQNGIIEEWNPALEKITGLNKEKVLGQSAWNIIPEFLPSFNGVERKIEQIKEAFFKYLALNKSSPLFEAQFQSKDGTTCWLEEKISVLTTPAGRKVLVLIRDITNRKLAEQRIATRNRQLEILHEIISTSNQAENLNELFKQILTSTIKLMDFDYGGVYTVDIKNRRAVLQYHHGLSQDYIKKVSIVNIDLQPYKTVFIDRKPMFTENIPEIFKEISLSLASVPLTDGDEIIGAINISSRKRHIFTEEEKNILIAIGQELGTVIKKMMAIQGYKRAEKALSQSEQQYRKLAETAPVGIYQTSANGTILYANNTLVRMMEFDSPEEIYNTKIGAHYKNPTEQEKLLSNLEKSGKAVVMEVTLVTKHRRERDVILSAVLEKDIVHGVIIDITDNKQAQQALIESEERYRNVVENANDAIYIITENNFVFVNKRFEEIFEYQFHEVCNESFSPYDIIAPQSREFIASRAEARKRGEQISSRYEFKAITKSNKIIDVEVNTVNIGKKGEVRVLGILREITEKKLLENQLYQAQKMEAIGLLAGGIAHEFNNLLTGIIGNLNLLDLDISSNNPLRELIQDAKQSAHRGANLTEQLLAFSRQTQAIRQPICLNTVVAEVKRFLEHTIDRRIIITVNLKEKLNKIKGDKSKLYQVILNLCINSRDAIMDCLDGGRCKKDQYIINIETQNIEIDEKYCKTHSFAKPGSYVLLTISDNGTGMDEKIKQRIFEPFFTTKDFGKGTGLGLASAYGIIKQHNGWINVHSEIGVGTSFKIYLPISKEAIATSEQKSDGQNIAGGSETILLVDDEQVIRNLGKRLLERKGYKVMVAEDGKKALEVYKMKQHVIDLIILDLTMPYLSGKEVLKKIRQINRNAKIILSSGFSSNVKRYDLESMGATDFISKPYQFQEFLGKIRKVLDL